MSSNGLLNIDEVNYDLITANAANIVDLEVQTIAPLSGNNIAINGNLIVAAGSSVTGATLGVHTGDLIGNSTGNHTGAVTGTVTGALIGNVTGTALGFTGALSGDVVGGQTTTQIAPSAVTTAKIQDGAVTSAKLSSGVVGTLQIADGSVTTPKLADLAVTAAKLATITTAGKVANSATTAASANTANAIVARDASGNFSANQITASLNGNAATATHASDADIFNVSLYGAVIGPYNNTQIVDGAITNAKVSATAAIVDTKLATIATTGKVSNSATTATPNSTANAIISRDANRDYSANTANLRNANLGTGGYGSITMGGGNSIGAIYPAFSVLGDGVHFGYNYASTEGAPPVVIAAGGGTSRITVGYSTVSICAGAVNSAPVEYLRVDSTATISNQNGATLRMTNPFKQGAINLVATLLHMSPMDWVERR